MSFRFRKRIKIGPFALNLSKNGISSLSVGGGIGPLRHTTNIPIARQGGVRQTSSVYGTGLSWSEQAPTRSTRERRQQQRPQAPTTTQQCVDLLNDALGHGPSSIRDCLWHQHDIGLVGLLKQRPETPRHILELTSLLDSADRCELHIRRGRGPADTVARLQQINNALQKLFDFARESGIYEDADE